MRVLHAYCLNYNIGDYALGIGERNLFRKYLDIDFIGTTNIQGRCFDEYYINEVVNKRYDLLVIGGGGIIHGSHWPNGWFWLINKKNIKKIKIPFIIYAAGVNYWENEKIPNNAVEHLKETFEYAKYFSVRNDGSLEKIKREAGITPFEIPDPGFHVGIDTDYPKLLGKKYVIIQLANDKQDSRFLGEKNIKKFILDMKEIVNNL
jgi:polysaccharide pyruvyl transferase WcaK-like protein